MSSAPAPAPQLLPRTLFRCARLHCTLAAETCAIRQLMTDRQRTTQTTRGQGGNHVSCDSRTCSQGRGIRAALEGFALRWTGSGPGHRWSKERSGFGAQLVARRRLAAVGLLDEVPTCDGPEGEATHQSWKTPISVVSW